MRRQDRLNGPGDIKVVGVGGGGVVAEAEAGDLRRMHAFEVALAHALALSPVTELTHALALSPLTERQPHRRSRRSSSGGRVGNGGGLRSRSRLRSSGPLGAYRMMAGIADAPPRPRASKNR